jgi:hypothetical protein
MLIPTVEQRMDPRDRQAVTLDFTDLMAGGETINGATLVQSLDAASAARGVELLTTAPYAPLVTGNNVRFWVRVADASQALDVYRRGHTAKIATSFETTAEPPRRLERTGKIRIVQL